MLYLFWALLNLTLFIFFIRICVKASKLVRGKMGFLASVIFAFGLLSFIGCSNNNNESDQTKTWNFVSADSAKNNSNYSTDDVLEDNYISKCRLTINCLKEKEQNNYIPLTAFTRVDGYVGGINWKPFNIMVEKVSNNKFHYSVDGLVEWRLLGMKVYSQSKTYNGFVSAKPV